MSDLARCQSCGGPMVWCRLLAMGGGSSPTPLDPDGLEPRAGLVALHPATGAAMVLTPERIERRLAELQAKGATFHTTHFETCPAAERHRGVSRDQGSLFG